MREEGFSHMRPVIEKELLHYDLLFALDKAGLLDRLTFQGGTSLRLCYGSQRFSEDLDFVGGYDFTTSLLMDMKSCIESYIADRYGLEIIVKEPSEMSNEPEYQDIKVDKWQITITTSPSRRDLPKQKIKIKVCNIPAYTRTPTSLNANYDFLPDGYPGPTHVLLLSSTGFA
jgi:predicted nucleotidyltransferase component of viral defense system